MLELIERWLAARESAAIRSAWTALEPTCCEVSPRNRTLTFAGAAQLAAAMLGERPDWLVDHAQRTPNERWAGVVESCFLDDAWDVTQTVHETWELHEQRNERGGVQLVNVGCSSPHGQPDGSGETVVRIFDHERAASVRIGTNKVSTVGEIDLAPLDLYTIAPSFVVARQSTEEETLRVLVEKLGLLSDSGRSVTVDRPYSQTTATVHGLPWGHRVTAWLTWSQDRAHGNLHCQLPNADIDRLLARLAAIP